MKKLLALFLVVVTAGGMVFADGYGRYGTPEGQWNFRGNRLYQNDVKAPRAKAWLSVPQNGSMVYEFTMRYEGGGEDGHGGVGIHILSDTAPKGKSWGMSDSWLLWLNYDENPSSKSIPTGLSAQVYKSDSNSKMEIVDSVSLKYAEPLLLANLYADIPVKLTFLSERGRLLIADPSGQTAGWYVDLPGASGAKADFVAVRTNGMAVSFASQDVKL